MTLKCTVIVPVLNGRHTIRQCMDSLLQLEYPPSLLEIIVVDNGSKDDTPQIVRDYPVRLLYEREKRDSYAARNAGVSHAGGDILAFTDADCIVSKEWLKLGTAPFLQEDVGCVAGGIEGYFPESTIERFLVRRNYMSQTLTLSHPFLPFPQTANALYRREIFDKLGGFRENLISGGDADLAWRMQIETSYQLVYVEDARVYHHHRSTVKGFLRQRMRWGYGSGILYNLYRVRMRERGCHPVQGHIRRFFSSRLLSGKERLRPPAQERHGKAKGDIILHLLSVSAWMIGFFYGTAYGRTKSGL